MMERRLLQVRFWGYTIFLAWAVTSYAVDWQQLWLGGVAFLVASWLWGQKKWQISYLGLIVLGVEYGSVALLSSAFTERLPLAELVLVSIVLFAFRFGSNIGYLAAILSCIVTGVNINSTPMIASVRLFTYFWLTYLVDLCKKEYSSLSKSNQDLANLLNIDEVTGVYTHRHFQKSLAEELQKSRVEGNQLSLLRISVDDYVNYLDTYDKNMCEQVLKATGELIRENIRGKDKVGRFGEEEFCVLLPGSDSLDALEVAEKIRMSVSNYNFASVLRDKTQVTVSLGIATSPKDAEDKQNLVYRANQSLFRARHTRKNRVCLSSIDIEEVQNKIRRAGTALAENIPTLVAILDAKDVNTCGHSERVTKYAVAIAKGFGLNDEEVESIQYGALLHDIGKINVEEHILDKPGGLSTNERYCIENHPTFGANFISSIDYLHKITPLVRYHHERWDGKGYPEGLTGEEIPFGARLIAVADAFDAMVSIRPYKEPLTMEQALEEIRRCAGTQFDPAVVDIFIKVADKLFPYRSKENILSS